MLYLLLDKQFNPTDSVQVPSNKAHGDIVWILARLVAGPFFECLPISAGALEPESPLMYGRRDVDANSCNALFEPCATFLPPTTTLYLNISNILMHEQ